VKLLISCNWQQEPIYLDLDNCSSKLKFFSMVFKCMDIAVFLQPTLVVECKLNPQREVQSETE